MDKKIEKIGTLAILAFGLFVIFELVFACFSDCLFYPIKSDTSYGYIEKSSRATIIPLNKYSKRFYAQIALPYEYIIYKLTNKNLEKKFDENIKRYGFQDDKKHFVIKPKYVNAYDFLGDYATVSIYNNSKSEKYGTINKRGQWIIQPKYTYICPSNRYYTRACIDKNHCGVIDKFGNPIILMTYSVNQLECNNDIICEKKFCLVGKSL